MDFMKVFAKGFAPKGWKKEKGKRIKDKVKKVKGAGNNFVGNPESETLHPFAEVEHMN
ncbi:MAG: hypothetical protein R3C26_09045 [Calditrichia bacterium]